jgi:hypothetical protein
MNKDALKLDDGRVIPGRIIRVLNKAKPGVRGEDEYEDHTKNILHMVWVEDANGKNERCLAFTPETLKNAEDLAKANEEDIPKKGLIQDIID